MSYQETGGNPSGMRKPRHAGLDPASTPEGMGPDSRGSRDLFQVTVAEGFCESTGVRGNQVQDDEHC